MYQRDKDGRIRASMGPAIFITGNRRTEARSRSPSRFNGAGDLHHRKLGSGRAERAIGFPASMGPVIFITGNGAQPAPSGGSLRASMGPVIFITGNTVAVFDGTNVPKLQWGR